MGEFFKRLGLGLVVLFLVRALMAALEYTPFGPTVLAQELAKSPYAEQIVAVVVWMVPALCGIAMFIVESWYQPVARFFARRIPVYLEPNARQYVVKSRGTNGQTKDTYDISGLLEATFESHPHGTPLGITIINASESRLINLSVRLSFDIPPIEEFVPVFELLPILDIAVDGDQVAIRMSRGSRTEMRTVRAMRDMTVTIPFIAPSENSESGPTGHQLAFPAEFCRALGLYGFVVSLAKGISRMQRDFTADDVTESIRSLAEDPVQVLMKRNRETESEMYVEFPRIRIEISCHTTAGKILKGTYECRMRFFSLFTPFQIEYKEGVGIGDTQGNLEVVGLELVD